MDKTYYDLLELFSESGCPICSYKKTFEEQSLDGLFYEFVTDPEIRQKLRDQGGFCQDHLRRVFDTRPSILGMSIVYEDLLNAYLKNENHSTLKNCPLCNLWKDKIHHLENILKKHWKDFKNAWGKHTFICIIHQNEIQLTPSISSELGQHTLKSLKNIDENLKSFIQKFDYQANKDTISVEESNSWQEVLEFFSGQRLRKSQPIHHRK